MLASFVTNARALTACLLGAALLALSACTGGATATPANPFGVPTLPPAPAFQQPGQPITAASAPLLSALGRLDAPGTPSTLFAYALSPDETKLVGLNNVQVLGWDLQTGALLFTSDRANATGIFFSPDKTEFYTTDAQSNVRIYSETGTFQNILLGIENASGVVAFDPFNGALAFASTTGDVKVWDVFTRTALATVPGAGGTVLAFSPDGALLASAAADGVVRLWDWATRGLVSEIRISAPGIRSLLFSPDGAQLAIAAPNAIKLWSLTEGREQFTLSVGGNTDLVKYAPDGRYLFAGGGMNDAMLWDSQTGALVATLPGVGGDRISADFAPDVSMMLTARREGAVVLWDLTRITGTTINNAALSVGSTSVLFVRWTGDSRMLLMVDAAGPVLVWGIPQDAPVPPTATP